MLGFWLGIRLGTQGWVDFGAKSSQICPSSNFWAYTGTVGSLYAGGVGSLYVGAVY